MEETIIDWPFDECPIAGDESNGRGRQYPNRGTPIPGTRVYPMIQLRLQESPGVKHEKGPARAI